MADLKADKKRNDGSSSHQSIGLDDEEDDIVVESGRATVPKDNRQVMRNKWEKARAVHYAVATKMSFTWTGIFSVREQERGRGKAHVGCTKGEDGLGPEEGGEEVVN